MSRPEFSIACREESIVPSLVCDRCLEVVCDVEAGDEFDVLVRCTEAHRAACSLTDKRWDQLEGAARALGVSVDQLREAARALREEGS